MCGGSLRRLIRQDLGRWMRMVLTGCVVLDGLEVEAALRASLCGGDQGGRAWEA